MRHILSASDWTSHDVRWLIDRAEMWKTARGTIPLVEGPRAALILERASLRTRLAYEGAVQLLDGRLTVFENGVGTHDSYHDVSHVFSALLDVVMIRTRNHATLEAVARSSSIPVVNALSDREHPVEVLADALTIRDVFGTFSEKSIAFVGGGGNVCASLLLLAPLLGMHVSVATPAAFAPDPNLLTQALASARSAGTRVLVTDEVSEAVCGAHVVYTDGWPTFENPEEAERRLGPYRVTAHTMAQAAPGAIFLHCLPAQRGQEVTAEVLDSESSYAFRRLRNLIPTTAAALEWALTAQNTTPS